MDSSTPLSMSIVQIEVSGLFFKVRRELGINPGGVRRWSRERI